MVTSLQREEDVFSAALELSDSVARAAFLEKACEGDAGLRATVEELLTAHAFADRVFTKASSALMSPSDEASDLRAPLDDFMAEQTGTHIGPYKLLQRLGQGGCGVVYMAEQEKPIRRQVAIKVIKLGMDTRSVIARFEAERLMLALMDHPNIARVLDAGTTETGRPYFVMELVRGVRITDYCDQNEMDTRRRLELFMKVCHAIQHAHQKRVIHRDIKPSNILVTMIDGEPVPKVIDFGIAKAIEGRLADNTIFTAYEQFIGTPAYMSPEQAEISGVDVDTRSDVYSLGVLLHELLTGRPPFETKELLQGGVEGLRHALRDQEPQRPSVMVATMQGEVLRQTAHFRQAEPPKKLISLLRGDLDWIVLRALEKDRNRRYETVNGFAMDVQRFLDNEPVVARRQAKLYRLQKLVRRNKGTFTAGAIIAMALIGALVVSTWFWHQEREARKRAVFAEQQQASLLAEAENRERITQAGFLITQNKYEEADQIVTAVTGLTPSLEAEAVLRDLGEWHALRGHWEQAAERFSLLLEADQKDNSWQITQDLLMAGPIQIERGNLQAYDRFRRAAIALYASTPDPIFAERTLKISLLKPADEQEMKSLMPLAEISAGSMEKAGQDPLMESWRCVSLALMAYRQNYTPTAKVWCSRCLAYGDDIPVRAATAHIIQAMSCYQLNEVEAARSELAQARKQVEAGFAGGLQPGGAKGFWFDWLFARILLREAEAMIEKSPTAGN